MAGSSAVFTFSVGRSRGSSAVLTFFVGSSMMGSLAEKTSGVRPSSTISFAVPTPGVSRSLLSLISFAVDTSFEG